MRQPLRSQSFKHRLRPLVEVKRSTLEDVTQERRRSTPTISRRCSLQRQRFLEPRTDVWPEAKTASEIEERFLKLPDSEEYKRVRQFKIDENGAVVSRGDSFRRRRNANSKGDKSPSPYPVSGSDSARGSRSDSVSSSEGSRKDGNENDPTTSHKAYKACFHYFKLFLTIYVVGDSGTGKSSLIGQLITSEYKNAFADEIQDYENTVSISIGGKECDLIFFESDVSDHCWLSEEVHAFVIVYSIDSRRSWKQALNVIEMIRESCTCRNYPILVAGNKVDLERKRTVTKNEVRAATATYGFEHFEISVALDHDVDDLLVGLVAEMQEAYSPEDMIEKVLFL
uniref:GTP-binding protein REM 1 n=1 Tax=Heterorhabditis bacteriophora TaxID=37862 RepID=A0A1I7XNP4_HETBA